MTTPADHLVVRGRWIILAVFVALSAWLLPGAATLQHDDDVLAFLPPDHPDVQSFRAVASRFGMLEMALVGLEASEGEDFLTPERVDTIRRLTTSLSELGGVRMVLSFVDLPDPRVTGEGLEVAALVPENVRTAEEIRSRVLRSPDAVGNLISADGRAAALLVYLVHAEGPDRTQMRRRVLRDISETTRSIWHGGVYLGGAPFAEFEAAESSRRDIERLSPIVIAVLAAASALLLTSVTAAFLNLLVAGLAVGLVMGAHGIFQEPLTIVSSTIPVMMVALGGAFGVHVLSGYQRQSGTPRERASQTLRELGVPVILSGLTTSVAFLALMVMPQEPMHRFGLTAGLSMLLLLLLALVLLPALLSLLPASWLPTRGERAYPLRFRPPTAVLVVAALALGGVGLGLEADPDTNSVFDETSAPRRANAFFDQHFGGSTFLQVAVTADLGEPVVLRTIRDLADDFRTMEGVVDVRTLVEPVSVLTAALGGRRGIPETPGRASRVLTYLADHPAMAQLMTPDRRAAILHIKLAPLPGSRQVGITEAIRDRLQRVAQPVLKVGSVQVPAVNQARNQAVLQRLRRVAGHPITDEEFAAFVASDEPDAAVLSEVRRLRDRALDSEDAPVEGVPREEIETLDPKVLYAARGQALEELLRHHLPTLVEEDPAGITFVADHLGPWIDEAITKWRVKARCAALGVDPEKKSPVATPSADPMAELFAEPAVGKMSDACQELSGTLSELDDDEWQIPDGAHVPGLREVPIEIALTGQPVLGQAFAQSVTENLRDSTLVSLLALAGMLALGRQLLAIVPAMWTLAITAGALSLLGQPISIGTSMIACIALGAGVDFAIHLGVRARRIGGPNAGEEAVHQIGIVILISGLTLALAFLVLLASDMPPLRDFGVGLAIGLVGAALGAVWWVPVLVRQRGSSGL